MESAGSIHTVGHSNRGADELIALLADHGIEEIADVRRFPGSRRNPQFNRDALERTLTEAGIRYGHIEALGGRRGRPADGSPNTGWRVRSFQAYADRMSDPDWVRGLEDLEERARRRSVAIMCAEAVPWRCHRRLIADALLVRGWDVGHLLHGGRRRNHELPDFARPLADGTIIYPDED